MPGFVIKDFPENLHRQLKDRAIRHHRSMAKEVLAMLEQVLNEKNVLRQEPPPYKGKFALTDTFIGRARREGRE